MRRLSLGLALGFTLFGGGCAGGEGQGGPSLAKVKPENGGANLATHDWSKIPVPSENGAKRAPISMTVTVRAEPGATAAAIGYLRAGARVARSAEPVSERECAGGWYAVRPVGFVCAGAEATTKLDHPVARALT